MADKHFIARRYALMPNRQQEAELTKCAAAARLAFNLTNEEAAMQRVYNEIDQTSGGIIQRPSFSFTAKSSRINQFTQHIKADHTWLCEVNSRIIESAISDCLQSWKRFFETCRTRRVSPPRFRAKGRFEAFTLRPGTAKVIHGDNHLRIGSAGLVRAVIHHQPPGQIKRLTIVRSTSRWIASVTYEHDQAVATPSPVGTPIAIDRGVAIAYAASDGRQWRHPVDRLLQIDQRIRQLQTKAARQTRGSARYRHTRRRIASFMEHAAAIRTQFNHHVTARLASDHDLIALEDLNIRNMTASARGTMDDPGTNVRAKSGLNRAILNIGWGEFARQIDYKTKRHAGKVVTLPPQYTSQRCSECGHIDATNRVTRSLFTCGKCGARHHADTNAAENLLTLALSGQTGSVQGLGARQANSAGDRQREVTGKQPELFEL